MKKHLALFFIAILSFSYFSTIPWGFSKSQPPEGALIPFVLEQQNSKVKISKTDLVRSVEKTLLGKSNDFRGDKRLNVFTPNPILEKAARLYSEDMFRRNYFSHFSPEGQMVLDRIRKLKPDYDESCGENLHQIVSPRGLTDPHTIANQIMEDWKSSPEHRKNLTSKDYALTGVGCATDGFKIYCTQVFSGPKL